jgi:hypothetical protein
MAARSATVRFCCSAASKSVWTSSVHRHFEVKAEVHGVPKSAYRFSRPPPLHAGLTPEIVGTYLIKIVTAGEFGATDPASGMDPDALREIVLRVGYRLATGG